MSLMNWLFLLGLYLLYLVLGMGLFHRLECPNEKMKLSELRIKQWEIARHVHLYEETIKVQLDHKSNILTKLIETTVPVDSHLYPFYHHAISGRNASSRPCTNTSTDSDCVKCEKWDWYNSFFFSFTAVTTIGYGHIFPVTKEGRLVCILYCLVGVPLNVILIGTLGNFFSIKVIQLKKKLSEYPSGLKWELESLHVVSRIILEGTCWIVLGTVLFMVIPAAIFHLVEGQKGLTNHESWDYIDTLYYTFITLSTIGFGDMVAARQLSQKEMEEYRKVGINSVEMMLYDIFIMMWILLGMGYIFMIVNVIAQGLQSTGKPVKKAIYSMKKQIQYSDYWRNIINELMIIKNWQDDDGSVGSMLNGIVCVESQPCLGDMLGVGLDDETNDPRKVKSTGDLSNLVGLEQVTLSPASTNKGYKRSTHSLQILDNDLRIPDTIQELNEDSIHSLREFLMAKNYGGGNYTDWLSNNVSNSATSTKPASRKPSKKSCLVSPTVRKSSMSRNINIVVKNRSASNSDQSDQSDPGHPAFTRVHSTRKRSNCRLKRANSNVSSKSGCSHKSQISNLLEQTTLAQFLEAAETVKKRAMIELPDIKTEINLKPQRRLSKSIGKGQQEKHTILQLSNMMASLKSKNDAKYGLLMQDSPTGAERGCATPTILVEDFSSQRSLPRGIGRFERRQSTPGPSSPVSMGNWGDMKRESLCSPLGRFERRRSTQRPLTGDSVGLKRQSLRAPSGRFERGQSMRRPSTENSVSVKRQALRLPSGKFERCQTKPPSTGDLGDVKR